METAESILPQYYLALFYHQKHFNLLCLWNSSGNRVEEGPWDISQGSEQAKYIFSVYLHYPIHQMKQTSMSRNQI